jgi:hypothetical protein
MSTLGCGSSHQAGQVTGRREIVRDLTQLTMLMLRYGDEDLERLVGR